MKRVIWFLSTIFAFPLALEKLRDWSVPFGENLRMDMFALAGVVIAATALILNYLEQIDRRVCHRLDESARGHHHGSPTK